MRCVLATLFLASLCLAQGPRILIVTDLEGVTGVNDAEEQLLPGQRRYLEAKRILVGEVNAAVEGAYAGGASEVVIWDGHDGSRTLAVDEIHGRAKLLQGRPTPANYYLDQRRYSGIIFVGQHPKAGTADGVLAHSQSFSVQRITLNGKEVGEIGQVAAIAGHFDIPVIMLAGDRAACTEIKELQPEAVTVAVKERAGKASILSLSFDEATRQIRNGATRAVNSAGIYTPWKVSTPVEMTIEYLPDPQKKSPAKKLSFHGQTVLEAYEEWLGKL